MPVLQTPIILVPKEEGLWIDTSAVTNIVVGVRGTHSNVQFRLGAETTRIYNAGAPVNGATLIAKANFVRVINPSKTESISYEIFA